MGLVGESLLVVLRIRALRLRLKMFFLHWLRCWLAEYKALAATCERIFTEVND